MRLLYLPLYTNKNLNGDSSYNVGKKLVRAAVELGWFVHWVLPKVGEGSRFRYAGERDPIERHPQVLVHRVNVVEDQYLQTGLVPVDFLYYGFSRHEGRYHVDAVLTEKPASANYVRKLLQHPFTREAKAIKGKVLGKATPVPVFVRDPFTKSMDVHVIGEVEELEQSAGYLLNEAVFMSPHDLNLAVAGMKRYMNFGQVKKFTERAAVIPTGTAVDDLKPLRDTVPKRDKFTVMIAERLTNGPTSKIFDAVDYMFKSGDDMSVVVSSQAEFNGRTMSNYPTLFEHAELYPANPREKYLPLAMSCHATVTAQSNHSYPQGLMEQLYLGLIAVVADFPWVDAVLPDYPFKVDRNMTALVGTLKWIEENYEEAKQRVAWVPEYIEQHYSSSLMMGKLLSYFETRTEELCGSLALSEGLLDIIDMIEEDVIDEEELYAFFAKNSRNGTKYDNAKKTAAFGNYKSMLFYLMKHRGWVDACDSPFVTMKRGS